MHRQKNSAILVGEQFNVGLEMFSSIEWFACSIFCSSKTKRGMRTGEESRVWNIMERKMV